MCFLVRCQRIPQLLFGELLAAIAKMWSGYYRRDLVLAGVVLYRTRDVSAENHRHPGRGGLTVALLRPCNGPLAALGVMGIISGVCAGLCCWLPVCRKAEVGMD